MQLPSSLNQKQVQKLLIGLVGVMAFFVWHQLFLMPQQKTHRELRVQVSQLAARVSLAKQKTSKLPEMRQTLGSLAPDGEAEEMNKPLPPEEQLPALLDYIAQTAKRSGVHVVSVRSQAPIAELIVGESGRLELPLEVEVEAGYHAIGIFLDSIEQAESFLVRIKTFRLFGNPEDIWKHKARFLFHVYLLPPISI